MRAIWKGSINFGLVAIPVGLAAATESKSISFRQICRREAAAECETAWHLGRDHLDHLPDAERAREEEHRELVLQEIEGLRDQAEYIEVTHAELPGRDGLEEYDAELLARDRQ